MTEKTGTSAQMLELATFFEQAAKILFKHPCEVYMLMPNCEKVAAILRRAASQDAREAAIRLMQDIATDDAHGRYGRLAREAIASLAALPQSAPALSPSQQAERLPSSDAAEAGADAVALANERWIPANHVDGRPTIMLFVPDGYKNADEFLRDCQFERAQPSPGVLTGFDAGGKAREALEPYCQHLQICSSRDPLFNNPCDCGLESALAAPQSQAGASEPVAWCGWHPERGYNFATMADTEQGAVSRLMRTGIAGHHGWSVRQLVYATPSPTAGIIYLTPHTPLVVGDGGPAHDSELAAGATGTIFSCRLPRDEALHLVLLELEDWDSRFDRSVTIAGLILDQLSEGCSDMDCREKEKPKVKKRTAKSKPKK